METTVIVIIGVCYIVLAICGISVSCESTRNKYKIRDLEIEVDILKDRDRINDKFTDNLYDSTIDCTNKINDLKKEIENLKQAMKTVIPPNDYRTIYCDGSHCTNPFRDCVNCPNQFGSGDTVTTTDNWSISSNGLHKPE